jgi:hypothetical protein
MIKTNTAYTYGFISIFSSVSFFMKSLGVELVSREPTFDWLWTPAQNAFGYMFLDFGWFGILCFFFGGIISRIVDAHAKASKQTGIGEPWREIQWMFAYACLSLPIVPAYDSVEFPLLIIMSVLIVRSATKSIKRSRVPELLQLQTEAN